MKIVIRRRSNFKWRLRPEIGDSFNFKGFKVTVAKDIRNTCLHCVFQNKRACSFMSCKGIIFEEGV